MICCKSVNKIGRHTASKAEPDKAAPHVIARRSDWPHGAPFYRGERRTPLAYQPQLAKRDTFTFLRAGSCSKPRPGSTLFYCTVLGPTNSGVFQFEFDADKADEEAVINHDRTKANGAHGLFAIAVALRPAATRRRRPRPQVRPPGALGRREPQEGAVRAQLCGQRHAGGGDVDGGRLQGRRHGGQHSRTLRIARSIFRI